LGAGIILVTLSLLVCPETAGSLTMGLLLLVAALGAVGISGRERGKVV
jgi:hypothetical protein